MPSKDLTKKYKFWNFLDQFHFKSLLIENNSSCISGLDPYLEQIFLKKLELYSKERPIIKMFAHDLDFQKLEQKLFASDLFSSEECLIIFDAHKLDSTIQGLIQEFNQRSSEQKAKSLILLSQEPKILADKGAQKIIISKPMFWEHDKLFNCLAQEYKLYFELRSIEYILDNIESQSREFIQLLQKIKLIIPEGKVKHQLVISLIKANRLDTFSMATLLSKKDLLQFYKNLDLALNMLRENNNFHEIFRNLNFFFGHLKKLLCPEYALSKDRKSKYDNEILAYQAHWKVKDLVKVINELAKIQDEIKRNKKTNILRSLYLEKLIKLSE